MDKKISLKITGRVQGVFFRASTRDKALDLGVKGFVMNMPGGSVYAEAEADENALDQFIAWCRKGPMMARVDKVDIEEVEKISGFKSFEIKY